MRGVHDAVCEVPVVCHQQQALGVHVQPPNGVDARVQPAQQLGHIAAALLVAHGGDVAPRLVEHEVELLLRVRELLSVHRNAVGGRVGPVAEAGLCAVDLDASGRDGLLRRAAGHEPGGGDQFLYSLCHRMDASIAWMSLMCRFIPA